MQSLTKLISKTYTMAQPRERRAVIQNAACLSGLQIITYILPIIIIPYLFQTLGAEKFGLLAFAQAFVQYFMMVTDYGFNISTTKEISLCRNDYAKVSAIFSSVITVKIVLALISILILCTIAYTVPKFKTDVLVYVYSAGMILGNALFPVWFYQGMEKMHHIANINIAGGLLFPFFIFVFVHRPDDFLLVPLINSGVGMVTGLLSMYVAFTRFKIWFPLPKLKIMASELRAGWYVFLSVVAINAYTTTRIFCMGLLTNNVITGYYSIAERIAGVCQTFPLNSFTQALFPRLSAIFHKNKAKAFTIMKRLKHITMIIQLLTLPVIVIGAEAVVNFVCGSVARETVLTLRMLLVSVFFISSNAFPVQFLLVCGQTKIYSRIHVSMALVALPTLFILIHFFSYIGAATATIAIEAGIFTITALVVHRLSYTSNRK